MRVTSIIASMAAMCFWSATAMPVDQQLALKEAGKRLIALSDTDRQWMTDDEVLGLIRADTSFIDVTDGEVTAPKSLMRAAALPATPTQQTLVKSLIAGISEAQMKSFLTKFTGYNNRYYKSSTGKAAALWLADQARALATEANAKGLNVTVSTFSHTWGQSSVIARINPSSGNGTTKPEVVVLGAHLDSINSRNPMSGRAPGADDDGSGSVTIFEAYRLLLANGVAPVRPIEFQWYAGEEAGLLGSGKIVADFVARKVPVYGMLQMDMTAYTPPNKPAIVGIATDFTDPTLSKFVQALNTAYCTTRWANVKCGYGCSDHASWNKAGFPAAFSFESSFSDSNPDIHSDRDTLAKVNYKHMTEFVKLATSFAVELGLSK
ncbi:hypothetical protein PhCBS80983_g05437 [Powellomyces hirtus]|uniref:Peptide hydrolase n=1 Tax=Powellomyces hirtus TaxID=109895 RepID=A0A507DUR8_9FUNG|nr:hypothetical protein PhCBS80983_g05437 [Powellomyces hirtus]